MRRFRPSHLVFTIVIGALILVAIVLLLPIIGTRSIHYNFTLDRASREMEARIVLALKSRTKAPLFALFDGSANRVETICFVTPYQSGKDVLPVDADVGGDESLLMMESESSIRVVALNGHDQVTQVAELSRSVVDFSQPIPDGRCYVRKDDPKLVVNGDGLPALMQIEISATRPD